MHGLGVLKIETRLEEKPLLLKPFFPPEYSGVYRWNHGTWGGGLTAHLGDTGKRARGDKERRRNVLYCES